MNSPLNISVLGAGAMGSLFGARLAESGQRVTLLDVNEAHLAQVREHGLRLATDDGDRCVRNLLACRPEQARGHPDLLLVFTKTLHTEPALESVAQHIASHTRVLSLQNGLGNAEALCRHVTAERVLIGMTTWPADFLGPGYVASHGTGAVRLYSSDGVERPACDEVAAVLQAAGLNCRSDPAVWSSIWEKVAFNAALNSLCAITGCTVGQLTAVPQGPELARAVVSEVIAVARAEGVEADVEHCLAGVAQAMAQHLTHKPSMLQDVLAGRPTEIGSINGEVVTRARRAGLTVPCTETLLGLLRLVEARALQAARCPSLPLTSVQGTPS
ncbi:2-dehydropantoate 2-reductase [Pseudomonas nitritireducens]|uniref:2-dehydropantoate 2-reductase n=1 Tax=Pseudomonas nitroreducens TaxID=46680 RepID=A0A7W7P3G8_PSENT|nr:2-dehydropantoate 2-reductase [Pseudomonas nitritireducens]